MVKSSDSKHADDEERHGNKESNPAEANEKNGEAHKVQRQEGNDSEPINRDGFGRFGVFNVSVGIEPSDTRALNVVDHGGGDSSC